LVDITWCFCITLLALQIRKWRAPICMMNFSSSAYLSPCNIITHTPSITTCSCYGSSPLLFVLQQLIIPETFLQTRRIFRKFMFVTCCLCTLYSDLTRFQPIFLPVCLYCFHVTYLCVCLRHRPRETDSYRLTVTFSCHHKLQQCHFHAFLCHP